MASWLADGIAMADQTDLEIIGEIFQENFLYQNELSFGDSAVNLGNIDMP